MLCKYMVTFHEARFTTQGEYAHTIQEAVEIANREHRIWGSTPEAIWEYNPVTDKYDKLYGRFKASKA